MRVGAWYREALLCVLLFISPCAVESHDGISSDAQLIQLDKNIQHQAQNSTRASKPNIVWIMADDLGYGEVGPFQSQHPRLISTPHLDKFASEGMKFTRAYAGYSVCAPSRLAFFSGRHAGNFPKLAGRTPDVDPGQNKDTLPHVLKSAGYTTGLFGKASPFTDPMRQGFDQFVGQVNQERCHNMYPQQIDTGFMPGGELNLKLSGNYQERDRSKCIANPSAFNYTSDVFLESAMAWMNTVAKGESPFFLYLGFTTPHAGGWLDNFWESGAPVPKLFEYKDESWPDREKDHAASITYLDENVGSLLSHLKSLGVDQDTVVFFASDNGAHYEGGHDKDFFNSTGGLRGTKRSHYEGGIRSPSMVRWPGRVPQGTTSTFAWAFWDVLPTLAELAGIAAPTEIDGMSVVPTLLGKEQAPKEYLYFTWEPEKWRVKQGAAPGYSMHMGQWKGVVSTCFDQWAVKPHEYDNMELYNLDDDPFEQKNVAGDNVEVVQKMKKIVVSKDLTCHCFQCSQRRRWVPRAKVWNIADEDCDDKYDPENVGGAGAVTEETATLEDPVKPRPLPK